MDHARARQAAKRAAGSKINLDDACVVTSRPDTNLILIDEALNSLALVD